MSMLEPPAASPEPRKPPSREARTREVVHVIAQEMARNHIPPGDQAALRREKLGPAFWRIAVRHLEPAGLLVEGLNRDEAERRWAAILAGLARAPRLHVKGRRLGTVLAEAKVVEVRLFRLTRSHGDNLLKAVRAVAQQLASGGYPLDWADFAVLIVSDGRKSGERFRRGLCRDFYRTERSSHEGQKEEKS